MKATLVKIGSQTFRAAVADNLFTRARGLSGRASLAADEAMLFTFSLPWRYSFWMQGMKFPLDVIWIRKGCVVDMSENVPLHSSAFRPKTAVDAVLEVNAGLVRELGVKIGDKVELGQ